MIPTVRFAPSPTGHLHLGNARTAILNWLFARKGDGRLILRIDDTDRERSRPEYEAGILEDLTWLGIGWDALHRQSERHPVYNLAFERLRAEGRAYPCYETAAELEAKRESQRARGLPPRYDRAALALTAEQRQAFEAEGRHPHWRFLLPDGSARFADLIRGEVEVPLGSLSDPIVCREDGSPTYLFASAIDDLDLGITHVIRGEDHLTNTGPQVAMAEALGGTAPAFAHLPLLQDVAGGKLSKRAGSIALRDLRAEGIEPSAVVAVLATIGTGKAPVTDPDALLRDFDLAAFATSPPRLDLDELRRATAAVLHAIPFAAAEPRLRAMGLAEADPAFWEAVRPNLEHLTDARDWWAVCHEPLPPVCEDPGLLAAAADLLPPALDTADAVADWLKRVGEATGQRGRALYHPLRLALTGRERGPELRLLLPLIGRDRAQRRLRGETA
jgi:glutamyl-tRNA synthetase